MTRHVPIQERSRIPSPAAWEEWLIEDARRELGELPEHVAERQHRLGGDNTLLAIYFSKRRTAVLIAALIALALAAAAAVSILRDIGWISER